MIKFEWEKTNLETGESRGRAYCFKLSWNLFLAAILWAGALVFSAISLSTTGGDQFDSGLIAVVLMGFTALFLFWPKRKSEFFFLTFRTYKLKL